MNSPNAQYDPETYWTEVGSHINDREGPSVLAGDDEPFDRVKRHKFVSQFLSKLGIEGKSCLEVGCGPGGNLEILQTLKPSRLVGVDISQTMVDIARSTTANHVEAVKIDGRSLPFADDEFDVVFCATVLMHNVDDVASPLLAEMCRVARERLVLFEEVSPRHQERYSYVKRTVADYAELCAAPGFTIDHVRYLRHEILQKLCRVPRRLLNPKGTHEGAARNRTSRAIEHTMIATFGWIDDVVRLDSGLAEIDLVPTVHSGGGTS